MAETKNAHTEVPSGAQAFPPFARDTFASQLVWLAFSFVVLYFLMARLALPRIGSIFAARQERIDQDLTEAERLRGESEAALAAYERLIAEARGRAQTMAAETHRRLTAEAEDRRKVLDRELNAKLAEAEQAIAATKVAAMASVRAIAAEAAAAIVERLIGTAPAARSVEAAVDEALRH
jgi:F-type H+-transporting ATPase subunit b